MHRVIHSESVKEALAAKGWDQRRLAEAVGVSAQAVTNWMKGVDFPKPPTLLKLSGALGLGFERLVAPDAAQPVVAFRKKGGAKTTDDHVAQARAIGYMLRPLVDYLPARQALHTQISDPSLEYERMQASAAAVRQKLARGSEAVLHYEHLISEFAANDAIVVPVLWGERKRHENALHILLPKESVTFVYLNLDTRLEDFKFWMAHELAHVYTPQLAGTDAGEDFADAFAGALLFPQPLAHKAYAEAARKHSPGAIVEVLNSYASEHSISLYSVYNEVRNYVKHAGLKPLGLDEKQVHAIRNSAGVRGALVSAAIFKPAPPPPSTYIAAAKQVFQSSFFAALQSMLKDRGTGAGYVQQVLSVSMADAQGLHAELLR